MVENSGINESEVNETILKWEDADDPLAPLSEKDVETVDALSEYAAFRKFPTDLPLDSEQLTLTFNNEGSEKSELANIKAPSTLENVQQFCSWFSELENEVIQEEDVKLKSILKDLTSNKKHCDSILEQVNESLAHVDCLYQQYLYVSNKTNALHDACEQLLADQTKLVNTGENITTKLSYFNELQNINQKLSSPTFSVLNESFVSVLSKIDECIAYLNSKQNYKESEVFLLKFKTCLARALGMIKTHVTSSLENATQQAVPKSEITPLGDPKHPTAAYDNAFTLFYGKFRTNAPRIKSLIEQIEDRLDKSDEYKHLLSDCHYSYFQQREMLLSSSVTSAISDLASTHKRDHCALVRSGCAFLIHVCEDEHQLYYQFFSHHSPKLDEFLNALCSKLYDMLRPLFIHVNHLETLAELCSILKIEMIEEHVQNSGSELNAFGIVTSQMLEDVQERLVYRSHIYIKTDILQYNPAPGDLAYPEKLQMMESIAESLHQGMLTRSDSKSSLASTNSSVGPDVAVLNVNNEPHGAEQLPLVKKHHISPADLHGMWYPTVRRTLVCLSKLYRCIDRAIFQGLSQEVLGVCIQSLIFASQQISKRKTTLDSQLFLIKHLLILREQIAPFQVDFAIKETSLDFSNIKNAAYGLIKKKNKIFTLNSNNALLEFIMQGTPQVMENFIDSKKDVDHQLKMVCEEFIMQTTLMLVGPIQEFISRANIILEMNKKPNQSVSLKDQPFAAVDAVADVISKGYKTLKTQLGLLSRSLALYLANKETEHILFKPVRNKVNHSFEQLIQIIKNNYPEEDQTVIACPTLEQINVLMNSAIAK